MLTFDSLQSPPHSSAFNPSEKYFSLTMNHTKILFLRAPKIDEMVKVFEQGRNSFGKLRVRFNLELILSNRLFFQNVSIILLTSYQDILYLPYILRMTHHPKIMMSTLMKQLCRVYFRRIHQIVSKHDRENDSFGNLVKSFQNQSQSTAEITTANIKMTTEEELIQKFEDQVHASIDFHLPIYTAQEIEETINQIICVNLHQEYTVSDSLITIPYSAGTSVAEIFWEVRNCTHSQRLLWIQTTQHSQETFLKFTGLSLEVNYTKIKHSRGFSQDFDYIIYAGQILSEKGGLWNEKMGQNKVGCDVMIGGQMKMEDEDKNLRRVRLDENTTLKSPIDSCRVILESRSEWKKVCTMIKSAIDRNQSVVLVLPCVTMLLELIQCMDLYTDVISARCLFCLGEELNQMAMFINSYVEYLPASYKDLIYSMPEPLYPLHRYFQAKSKGRLKVGSLSLISMASKIPISQIILTNSPSIYACAAYDYFTTSETIKIIKQLVPVKVITLDFPSSFKIKHTLQAKQFSGKSVISFCDGLSLQELVCQDHSCQDFKNCQIFHFNNRYLRSEEVKQVNRTNYSAFNLRADKVVQYYTQSHEMNGLIVASESEDGSNGYYLHLGKDYLSGLMEELQNKQIALESSNSNRITTLKGTQIIIDLDRFKVAVVSKDAWEAMMIKEILKKCLLRMKLR